jgi:uncharacterized membrane protein YfcA
MRRKLTRQNSPSFSQNLVDDQAPRASSSVKRGHIGFAGRSFTPGATARATVHGSRTALMDALTRPFTRCRRTGDTAAGAPVTSRIRRAEVSQLAGLTSVVYHAGVPALLIALAVAAAAFVKGSIGFGFPTLGTPLLTLIVDVKTAFLVLIIPNIVMDGLQFARRGAPSATVRRMAPLVACGAVGTVVGTRLLVALSSRTVMLILGGFLLAFVALNVTRLSPQLPPRWEPWASPIAGFAAGVVGGITNVPGTPLVIYFYALRLSKPDFVSAVAFTFVLYKVVQLGAVTWYGLFTWSLLGWSLLLTLAALGGFALGLRVQDRLEQQMFNRIVLVFLAVLGGWLVLRSL